MANDIKKSCGFFVTGVSCAAKAGWLNSTLSTMLSAYACTHVGLRPHAAEDRLPTQIPAQSPAVARAISNLISECFCMRARVASVELSVQLASQACVALCVRGLIANPLRPHTAYQLTGGYSSDLT
jgi:hypothetical protein